ncbi:MAG: nucleotidyltransferase [Bariatricus sp.]|nr:nucleotidyltransferase [Bariatricus sp.]
MKIVGLIAEYNPFHNGHKYHIEAAIEATGSDAAIVLMSGNFVQRGTPAIMPKQLRAEAALRNGASLVLELPVCFACGSAEYFARGAVGIFDALGCVDCICFGSESGNVDDLEQVARILDEEPEEYRTLLKSNLKSGISFPLARQKAIKEYTQNESLAALLASPNNTLGIEYIKALHAIESPMTAFTIKRVESDYHDTALTDHYSSASAIRNHLSNAESLSDTLLRLKNNIPENCLRLMEENYQIRYPVYADDLSLLLKYRLLSETKDTLTEYADVTEELACRIMNRLNGFLSWNQFCDLLKTKEVTYTRISRALLHILLGIRKEDMKRYTRKHDAMYARVLGFRKSDAGILTELKRTAIVPIITKLNQASLDEDAHKMLQTDLYAADIYESVLTCKYHTPYIPSPSHPLVIL